MTQALTVDSQSTPRTGYSCSQCPSPYRIWRNSSADSRWRTPTCGLEKVPKFVSKLTPAAAMATLHENYGIIQGLAYAQGYALHRVEPKIWQDPLGLGGRKSCATGPEWKRKLKSKAQELFPHLDVTLKKL